MTPKEAIERLDDVSCDAELINAAKFAIRRLIPRFVSIPGGWQGFRRTRYICPACKKPTRDHEEFCHTCGQAVKYPKLTYSKAENEYVFDWSDGK